MHCFIGGISVVSICRIGRTGRFGRSGIAINFVDGRNSMKNLKTIEQHFGRPIIKLDTDDYDSIEQAISS